jgi:hypothetical protein
MIEQPRIRRLACVHARHIAVDPYQPFTVKELTCAGLMTALETIMHHVRS